MFRADDALLLLHLQNEVVRPTGVVGRRGVGAVVERLGLLERAAAARDRADAAGAVVSHVVFEADATGSCRSTAANLRAGARAGFAPGGWGVAVADGLSRPGDLLVPHGTMSAFAGTALADRLRAAGVRRVVLGGVSTHLVVAATAFAAADDGFEVLVLADCCAAPTPEQHAAGLAQVAAIGSVA